MEQVSFLVGRTNCFVAKVHVGDEAIVKAFVARCLTTHLKYGHPIAPK